MLYLPPALVASMVPTLIQGRGGGCGGVATITAIHINQYNQLPSQHKHDGWR